jgi:hypothetical protein
MEQMHDLFITELFNDNLFEPSGLLTFPSATPAGGKKRYRSKKNKTKKNKTKKIKSKKNNKRKNTKKYKNY